MVCLRRLNHVAPCAPSPLPLPRVPISTVAPRSRLYAVAHRGSKHKTPYPPSEAQPLQKEGAPTLRHNSSTPPTRPAPPVPRTGKAAKLWESFGACLGAWVPGCPPHWVSVQVARDRSLQN